MSDAHYDLVLALSVFTHLTDLWSDWLLELNRILRDGGLLIATSSAGRRPRSTSESPTTRTGWA